MTEQPCSQSQHRNPESGQQSLRFEKEMINQNWRKPPISRFPARRMVQNSGNHQFLLQYVLSMFVSHLCWLHYVYLCLSMFIYVYLCLSTFIYVYLCLSMFIYIKHLVGGATIILKNDGVRQCEGWHPIYEMENKNVWNHQPFIYVYLSSLLVTLCLSIFLYVYLCLWMFIYVHLCLSMFIKCYKVPTGRFFFFFVPSSM